MDSQPPSTPELTQTAKIAAITAWLGAGSLNIFGRPFAGKDTQGSRLAELCGGHLLGGGDILRSSVIPPHVRAHMDAGRLIPIADYIALVLPYLSHEHFSGDPLILSSVGRWHGEEPGVLQATAHAGHPLKAAIYLHIREEAVRQRWQTSHDLNMRSARPDDTPEILEIRLQEYREKTLPVLAFYREKGLLTEVEAEQDTDTVFDLVVDALYARAQTAANPA